MKVIALPIVFLAAGAATAETKYFGIYFNEVKVGYASRNVQPSTWEGRPAIRIEMRMVTTATLGTAKQKSVTEWMAWTTSDNRPLRETFVSTSGRERSKIETVFGAKTAEIDAEVGGKKTHQTIALPDGPIYEDLATANLVHDKLAHDKLVEGGKLTLWSLWMGGTSFTKVEFKALGSVSLDLGDVKVPAFLTEMNAGGTTVKYYTSPDGDLLRQEFAMGMVMRAVPKAVALAPLDQDAGKADLLTLHHLQADHPLGDSEFVYGLGLRITGEDLSKLPSDEFQTVAKDGDGWLVAIHPPLMQFRMDAPLAGVEKGKEKWTRPSRYLPSDDPKIKAAAQEIVGKGTNLQHAVEAIRTYVQERMKYEIGFGKTRDAAEILRKPKGKCTDYAILTTALLRAAGIPARVVCGLVADDDGGMDYHAWSEAWDGERWIGVDALARFDQVVASYVKLAQGNVEEAFGIDFLDPKNVKIHVLRVEPLNKTPVVYRDGG